MTLAVCVVLFIGVTAYALFGGADFGAGFWDLLAGNAERGRKPRAVADRAIGPVWEANHVWLIFILVVLWTAFAGAFAAIMQTLFVPLCLAALGIVLRGAGFAFRKEVFRISERRDFGATFACASVLVPYCLGAVVGAIASGRVPAGAVPGDRWASWLNPTSTLAGVLAVTVCAYLAAVYLTWDAHRLGEPDMVAYFRRRALISGVVAGSVAGAGIFVLAADAPELFARLTTRGLPLVLVSVACGAGALALLLRRQHFLARGLAMGAVATVIWGWGVAQWPYLLPGSLTVEQGAAPEGTLLSVLVVFALAALIILPSLGFLYVLHQRGELEGDEHDA